MKSWEERLLPIITNTGHQKTLLHNYACVYNCIGKLQLKRTTLSLKYFTWQQLNHPLLCLLDICVTYFYDFYKVNNYFQSYNIERTVLPIILIFFRYKWKRESEVATYIGRTANGIPCSIYSWPLLSKLESDFFYLLGVYRKRATEIQCLFVPVFEKLVNQHKLCSPILFFSDIIDSPKYPLF